MHTIKFYNSLLKRAIKEAKQHYYKEQFHEIRSDARKPYNIGDY